MCGPQQKKCLEKIPFLHDQCLDPCQGLIVSDISADFFGQNETETQLGDLLEEYERYKRQFQDEVIFPDQLKSNIHHKNIQPVNNIFDCISMQNFNL